MPLIALYCTALQRHQLRVQNPPRADRTRKISAAVEIEFVP